MKFGLLGHNIQNSLSPELYRGWFEEFGIDASYELIDIDSFEIPEGFTGLNITSPFKRIIYDLSTLSDGDDIAPKTESANMMFGEKRYNTDYYGFVKAMDGYDVDNNSCLIIGTGGVMPTVRLALYDMGAAFVDVTRHDANIPVNYDIIVNCSRQHGIVKGCIDLNYTDKNCFGYEMLKYQAAKAFQIWTGINPINKKEIAL